MTLVCRTCARVNPPEARYCYHDGVALDGRAADDGPVAVGAAPFPRPFVFPSGRSCRNFDELVLACETDWSEARELLRRGYLEGFLGGLGRADLARTARQCAGENDRDRALDRLLTQMPGDAREAPRVSAQPLDVNLGQLRCGQDHRFFLHLENGGMGLLHGTVRCEDTPWLVLGEDGTQHKLFQCRGDVNIPVRVLGKCLRAGARPQEGRLSIESNGGTLQTVVRVEVPVQPFPDGVLAGARTPRQIAEKAKAAPKAAAALFEKGAVAAWYESNGWTYPVQAPSSSGLGAVQQFFEALGLVTPPPVTISTRTVELRGEVGESLRDEIQVRTAEKRPVWASVASSTPWIRVRRVRLQGQTATLPFEVPSVPALPGERLKGQLLVTANGNQRFTVEVVLEVAGRKGGHGVEEVVPILDVLEALAEPAPRKSPPRTPDIEIVSDIQIVPDVQIVPSVAPWREPQPLPLVEEALEEVGPVPATLRRRRPREDDEDEADPPVRQGKGLAGRLRWLPVAFLALGLLVTLARDVATWFSAAPALVVDNGVGDSNPRIALAFHDTTLDVTLGDTGVKPGGGPAGGPRRPAKWAPSMRFGLIALSDQGRADGGRVKRLTFEEQGLTNNVCVHLDGREWLFGERPFLSPEGRELGSWPGHWLEQDTRLDATSTSAGGRRSVWAYDNERVHVTQTVEVVRGPQSGLFDTCLIRYRLENKDSRPHTVGIRFLLDTFIGDNDGVPFLIPGAHELCATKMEFNRPEAVPDFIQACEHGDLVHPGTIARVGLRLGDGIEPPARVTLGAWPNPLFQKRGQPRCLQEKTLWEVPVLDIHALDPADSAVVIYWNPAPLKPGQTREVGFSYGLGSLSGGEGGGKLALTVGGSFVPGGEFTVTAYVNNPVPGQTVTLSLPGELQLSSGAPTQEVPSLPPAALSRNSPVTWKVKATREGDYTLKVQSSTGASQTQPVKIRVRGIFGN
jgi:hypothetical protein